MSELAEYSILSSVHICRKATSSCAHARVCVCMHTCVRGALLFRSVPYLLPSTGASASAGNSRLGCSHVSFPSVIRVKRKEYLKVLVPLFTVHHGKLLRNFI